MMLVEAWSFEVLFIIIYYSKCNHPPSFPKCWNSLCTNVNLV